MFQMRQKIQERARISAEKRQLTTAFIEFFQLNERFHKPSTYKARTSCDQQIRTFQQSENSGKTLSDRDQIFRTDRGQGLRMNHLSGNLG